jgi:hypothetical protein
MRRLFTCTHILLISVFILLIPSFYAVAQETQIWTVVDGIVATIGNVPVLRSDVQMEEDLGLLQTSESNDGFEDLLDSYINRLLILKELEDIGGYRLAEGQAEGVYREYLAEYDDMSEFEEKLNRWGIGGEEVYRRLEHALLASLYSESRIKFYVKVVPADIERAYEENPERWGKAGVFEAWETIKEELTKESFMREKNRWLASLRQRYDLVMLETGGDPQQ